MARIASDRSGVFVPASNYNRPFLKPHTFAIFYPSSVRLLSSIKLRLSFSSHSTRHLPSFVPCLSLPPSLPPSSEFSPQPGKPGMKKVVLKLDIQDSKGKQKAMKAVSALSGIDSIAIDMKEKKLTVIGGVDPVSIVSKLRKHWPSTGIVSVGPAKEPEKKEEAKKDEPKKEEAKKDEEPKKEEAKEEAKKEEPKKEEAKKEETKKDEPKKDLHELQIAELVKAYKAYNPQMTTYYYSPSIEENPNACVIC